MSVTQFIPPDADQRRAAIGPGGGLSQGLRRALDPGEDFQPLPVPSPSDWLANHPEAGQTFEQFVRLRPNRPDSGRPRLYLQPLGSFGEAGAPRVAELAAFAEAFFSI